LPFPTPAGDRDDAETRLSDLDHTLSDLDQTHADADQTASDADHAAAAADQQAADSDQRASARDQAAADREHAGQRPDPELDDAYEASRAQRSHITAEREANAAVRAFTSLGRAREAAERDEAARLRDAGAIGRDRATEARDRAAELREDALALEDADAGAAVQALRETARVLRATAAADRARAAADRRRAAEDRTRAAEDRRHAQADLRRAHLDDLTGVYTRGFGLLNMEHEIERAHRSGDSLVLAFVDVDGLKQINDQDGHAAGDAVLRAVGEALRANTRSYDVVVRVGGDEFNVSFSGTALDDARARVVQIRAALPDVSISCGLAELRPGESLHDLTARGDTELYRVKQGR
jgi:diguanylate cyclase (GGDEF)-like protein